MGFRSAVADVLKTNGAGPSCFADAWPYGRPQSATEVARSLEERILRAQSEGELEILVDEIQARFISAKHDQDEAGRLTYLVVDTARRRTIGGQMILATVGSATCPPWRPCVDSRPPVPLSATNSAPHTSEETN